MKQFLAYWRRRQLQRQFEYVTFDTEVRLDLDPKKDRIGPGTQIAARAWLSSAAEH
jgi:hypothetical protein